MINGLNKGAKGHNAAFLLPPCLRAFVPLCLVLALLFASGCADPSAPKKLPPRYTDRGVKEDVPSYLKGTILEVTDLEGTEALQVSGWGLVANLRDTGDSTAPTAVRQYMVKELVRHGFGTTFVQKYRHIQPEAVLRDPRVAIVRVDTLIPPGARVDQRLDALVSCLDGNNTTSLAHGQLYATDLKIDGADPVHPEGKITVMARVDRGQIFVNPVYATDGKSSIAARASLRNGVVMDGARVMNDRPLVLRVRRPQYSLSRAIERVIEQRFQSDRNDLAGYHAARAQDEAVVWIYPPKRFDGDWRHFAGLVSHLYLNNAPGYEVARAKQLAEAALQPDAPLMDISYALEGLDEPALPFIRPLMDASNKPDVRYAAARAAAFIGDPAAQQVLVQIAQQNGNPFQINAVQTLGALPPTPAVSQLLRQMLNTDQTLVRLEAYRVLARNNDSAVFSKAVQDKFILDFVPCDGPPLLYASRTGVPRIAIFGKRATIPTPVVFTAMDDRFSLSASTTSDTVTLFYRSKDGATLQQQAHDDLGEIIARLGGDGAPGEKRFDLSYGDIVGILQGLASNQKVAAAFVLQDMPATLDPLYNVPVIGEESGRAAK
jgi:flagellar basal body P-ring protein FlgI